MDVVLLLFLTLSIRAELKNGVESRDERLASDDNFENELEQGYQMLKGVPNADNTKELLGQLHKMEPQIKQELILSPERKAELQEEMKNYVEIENDHGQLMGQTIEEINLDTKVDRALFQGDILLTKEQADEIIEDVKENKANRSKRQAYRDSRYPNALWSNGVSYSFHWNATHGARRVFRKATQIWQDETCINFFEDNTASGRIVVFQGPGCYSNIGRIGGIQTLSLGPRCEQNGWISQFTKQSEHTNFNYNLTYDYGSIMHYGALSVSRNGQPVMVPRDMKYIQTLGTRVLSFYEKLMMNLHYKCLDKCKSESSAKCKNGGFPHPRDCSKCTCPSGYGGTLCDERVNRISNKKTLTATTSYQTLEDTVGERGARNAKDEFTMCHYWIKGPAGSTIEVILDEFSHGVSNDGCNYAGVEIKTGSDKRRTGYRFCSPRFAGTSLVSTHNIVPIITFSRLYEVKTVLRYRIASTGTGAVDTETEGDETTPQPAKKPNKSCKDINLCTKLLQWDFCNDDNYDDKFKKLACPKSCGFC
ncbi:unnamed protein product [Angiostrongylus costaricensis]|uniref:Zinc metalloproteinase n=1 Tax=Angiostrongylus costaricensis TaxID=334426 RepID=A0A0R3PGS4_ANGCS|nr:unnamed protein product [Angiostrongylus costaricensis]